jgi:hypothetical protein
MPAVSVPLAERLCGEPGSGGNFGGGAGLTIMVRRTGPRRGWKTGFSRPPIHHPEGKNRRHLPRLGGVTQDAERKFHCLRWPGRRRSLSNGRKWPPVCPARRDFAFKLAIAFGGR